MNEEQPTARMPENASGNSDNSAKRPPLLWWIGSAVILAALIGALYYFYFSKGSLLPGNIAESNAGAVALINGEKISKEAYEARFVKEEAALKASGVDASAVGDSLKQQVLDNLIAEALLLQEARKKSITITDEEIEAIISENRTRFEAEASFQKALETEGLTLEKFRKLISDQLTIQKLLEASIDFSGMTASNEEIRAYYEQSIAGSEAYPQLEEVRGQIESFVVQNKQQELVAEFVRNLRNESDIEITL